jgi:hypothetical protein
MSLGSVITFWFLTRGYGRLDLFPVGTPSVFPNADVVKERRPATGQADANPILFRVGYTRCCDKRLPIHLSDKLVAIHLL